MIVKQWHKKEYISMFRSAHSEHLQQTDAHLTSVRSWLRIDPCRCRWQAGRPSPSLWERNASCETRGSGLSACRKRSWSSKPRDGADSRIHSLYWCYTPAYELYCSPVGSEPQTTYAITFSTAFKLHESVSI